MTTEDRLRKKVQFKGSRRPAAQKLKGRKTTITNAFALSVLPVVNPSIEEIHKALEVLHLDPNDVRCAYCGDASHGWDHLRPVVRGSLPTGYITEIANMVPACGKCNSSKGGSDWRTWMQSASARGSPSSRGITDVHERMARLEEFEKWRQPVWIDFKSIVGEGEWESYWQSRNEMIARMMECQSVADTILQRVEQHLDRFRSARSR